MGSLLRLRLFAALLLLASVPAWAGRADVRRCVSFLKKESLTNTTVTALSDEEFTRRGWGEDLGHHSFAIPSHTSANGRIYLAFGSLRPSSPALACEAHVRASMLAPLQNLVAAHELAHCRFARFFERNAAHLSWRIPAPWAFDADDGTLWVDQEFYLLMSERYALGTEILLRGAMPTGSILQRLNAVAAENLGLNGTAVAAAASATLWSLLLGRNNGPQTGPASPAF